MAQNLMQQLATVSQTVCIEGRCCRIFPFTMSTELGHSVPLEAQAGRRVHDAAASRRAMLGRVATTHGLLVRRQPTGPGGEALQVRDHAQVVLLTCHSRWEAAGATATPNALSP